MPCGVYLLKCESGKYYLGSSNDLERRLAQHRSGMVKSTKRLGGLLEVAAFQATANLQEARRLEKMYKSWKHHAKVLVAMQPRSSPDPVGVGPRFES